MYRATRLTSESTFDNYANFTITFCLRTNLICVLCINWKKQTREQWSKKRRRNARKEKIDSDLAFLFFFVFSFYSDINIDASRLSFIETSCLATLEIGFTIIEHVRFQLKSVSMTRPLSGWVQVFHADERSSITIRRRYIVCAYACEIKTEVRTIVLLFCERGNDGHWGGREKGERWRGIHGRNRDSEENK